MKTLSEIKSYRRNINTLYAAGKVSREVWQAVLADLMTQEQLARLQQRDGK